MVDARDDPNKKLSDDRADFMKRWFAIAISVGFATALSNMPWLKNQTILDSSLPIDWDQVKQGIRLTTAAIATILSWDGYFRSIHNKPLIDGLRFSIDIFLVFLYFLLLLTSKFDYFWLWIHSFAFFIYGIWDVLSMRMHPRAYVTQMAPEDFKPNIREIYRGCINGDEWIYKGPIITLSWLIYFVLLPFAHQFILTDLSRQRPEATLCYAILVILGLFSYRHDKKTIHSRSKRIWIVAIGVLLNIGVSYTLRFVS